MSARWVRAATRGGPTNAAAALLVILAASRALDAAPRPPPPPPLPASPSAHASTDDPVAVLRTPTSARVLIRAGTFTMGSSDTEFATAIGLCRAEPRRDDCKEEWFAWEQSPHEVYLDDYWIDRTEVTVASHQRCVAAGQCPPPPYASGGVRFDEPDLPVVLVTWSEARRYCAWAGGRLPTEAEWERAARGLGGRRYPWGNVYNPFLSNHGVFGVEELFARDGFLELAPVGSFPDGRTPDGIDDLAGNVQEWVHDWFAPQYPEASAHNPRGPDVGEHRITRGGSYVHGRPWLRGASRDPTTPSQRAPWIGFRCAADARPAR